MGLVGCVRDLVVEGSSVALSEVVASLMTVRVKMVVMVVIMKQACRTESQ